MIELEQTLDALLAAYRQGRMDRKELESTLFMYIKNHPRRFSLSHLKGDREDFISWLYPRLSRAVDRYVDQGVGFDPYFIAMVKLSAREYGLRQKEHQIIEKTWWSARAEEMAVCEEEETYESEPKPKKVSNPRQVLMLLLKSYYYLSDDHLSRLAPALGLEKEELYRMVDEMRVLRLKREENINGLKERIHGQFYRCLAFEKRMRASPLYSLHWHRMKNSLETARKRLASMRRHLQTMRIDASNDQVARVLRVAKGTVDSSLYAVRQRNQTENQ
ncbi:MAG: hypothetical protein LBD09_06690 [Treponema sp.]|jgi:hypothetical protein|nr:hypothetical protein [Treponema sp.]